METDIIDSDIDIGSVETKTPSIKVSELPDILTKEINMALTRDKHVLGNKIIVDVKKSTLCNNIHIIYNIDGKEFENVIRLTEQMRYKLAMQQLKTDVINIFVGVIKKTYSKYHKEPELEKSENVIYNKTVWDFD